MPFKDLPEGETHSYLDPDWVSDCCGAKMETNMDIGITPFRCSNCKKSCQSKQLHDIKIVKIKK